jgi:putative YphP/YqiW family bacilliredoxin
VFVVSAVESLSDVVLANLEKGHTAADVPIALDIVRRAGIALRPSFVTFTPWTTLEDYERLLDFVLEHDWIPEVDPVQFAIRLLIPPGSSLVSSSGMRSYLGVLDGATFSYQWAHPDPRMDRLHGEVRRLVEAAASEGQEATATFEAIREAVRAARGVATPEAHMVTGVSRTSPPSPRLTESWFCCAEPTETQMDALGVGILPAVPTSLEDEMASLNVSMYDPRLVQPMRDELTRIGFEELRTPEQVDAVLATTKDTTLVLVNSVCGCAARNARPAAAMAIQQAQRPQKLLTVFAGQDADATNRARSYFAPYPPSSPQMGLFKDGKLVFMLERRNIEGRPAQEIAADLMAAFAKYC